MDALQNMIRRFANLRELVSNRRCNELAIPKDLDPTMQQLGLETAMVDQNGRIWVCRDRQLTMIFDPMWLHPSKRWCGPTEVPRR